MRRTGCFIWFGLGASAAILFYLPQWTHLSAAWFATSAGRLHTSSIQNMPELLWFVFSSLVRSRAIMKWDKASQPGNADGSWRRLKVLRFAPSFLRMNLMNKHPHGFGWNGHQTLCASVCWCSENAATWRRSTHRSFDCPDYITTGFTKGLNPLAHRLDAHQYKPSIWGCCKLHVTRMNFCETRMTWNIPRTDQMMSCTHSHAQVVFFPFFFKGQLHEAEFVVLGLAERMQLGPTSHSGMIELA